MKNNIDNTRLLFCGGHILARRSIFLCLLPLSIWLFHLLYALCSQSSSLSPTFPFIQQSLNLSPSVSFATIYLSFLTIIYLLYSSTFHSSLRILQCFIWIHFLFYHCSTHCLSQKLESQSFALWESICLSHPAPAQLSKWINTLCCLKNVNLSC